MIGLSWLLTFSTTRPSIFTFSEEKNNYGKPRNRNCRHTRICWFVTVFLHYLHQALFPENKGLYAAYFSKRTRFAESRQRGNHRNPGTDLEQYFAGLA